ncbi:MAG TPA: SgcJ/EcaC family oxidoreductase [Acidimicrobiia bacterium]|nr:SgcJ/EcaC family oxidoreductase [Acidimicrobiia bacterium]
MPSPEQIRAAVDAYCDAYDRSDKDAFLDAFSDDGVVIDPVGTPAHTGREARAAFWDTVHELAESISFEVHHVHICGDEAAMVFTINARTGAGGMAIDAVDVFQVGSDGRIRRLAAYWDMAAARPLA